jgi:hypothetical protein
VLDYAIDMGYMSKIHIPKLQNDGTDSEPRPAFTKIEYKSLVGYMTQWSKQGHTQRTKDMRELLRDTLQTCPLFKEFNHQTQKFEIINLKNQQVPDELFSKIMDTINIQNIITNISYDHD